ncbi:MAG: oligosaccharide flippase family protein [Saprospiraceae bacterium]
MKGWRSDTQLTLLSRIPIMLLSFISVVLLTRLLGPEGNGVYTYAYTVLNLLLAIFGFQLDGSLTYFLPKKDNVKSEVLSTIGFLSLLFLFMLIVFLAIVVFIIPGAYQFFIPPGQDKIFFFVFLIISFTLRHATQLIWGTMRGFFRFKAFNSFSLLWYLIPVIVYGALFVMSTQSFSLPLLSYFKIIVVTEGLLVLAGVIILFSKNKISFSANYKKLMNPVFNYSRKNLMAYMGHFFNKRLDVWFVQHFKGTLALGQYGLATQISNFISEALVPFNQVLFPYITGSDPDQHKMMVGRIARLNFAFSTITALIIFISARWFIPLLFGNQFSPAINATMILSIGIIFISQRLIFSNYFKATNNIKYVIRAAWIGVAMTILFDILLIPTYGIVGAAVATVIAYGTTSLLLIVQASGKLGFNLADILLLRRSDIRWLLSRGKENEPD